MKDLEFVDYDESILDKSWEWINDSEIKQLIMAESFTREEQKKWYEQLKGRNDYLIWGIRYLEEPIGVVGLKHIDFISKECEYFGYIGEKKYWGCHIGHEMLKFAIAQAMSMQINRMNLIVWVNNQRAIRLYKSFQFNTDYMDETTIHMYKNLHGEKNNAGN